MWTSDKTRGLCLLIGMLLFAVGGCNCNGKAKSSVDGGTDTGVDARESDARLDGNPETDGGPDSGDSGPPDAQWPPEPIYHDSCDATFFKLPIDGQTEQSYDVQLWGNGVIYEKRVPEAYRKSRLYYLDLETCKKFQLTREIDRVVGESIYENTIIYSLCRECTTEPFKGSDLYRVNLQTWTKERLTDDIPAKMEPKHNGRHIIFLEYDSYNPPNPPPMRLVVWDMLTENEYTGDWPLLPRPSPLRYTHHILMCTAKGSSGRRGLNPGAHTTVRTGPIRAYGSSDYGLAATW